MNSDKSSFITPEKAPASTECPARASTAFCNSKVAKPLHVQALEQRLDLSPFLDQLEHMLSKPLLLPNGRPFCDSSMGSSFTNLKKLWADDTARKKDMAEFYNFKTVGKRKWLKNLLLEDSESESDERPTDTDIKVLLKIHKYRRKYQKRYHTDIMNSQCTYYAAGLLSEYDYHPEHQAYITEQYGFSSAPEFEASLNVPLNGSASSKKTSSSSAGTLINTKNPVPTSSLPSCSGKRKSCGSLSTQLPTHFAQSKRCESAPKSVEHSFLSPNNSTSGSNLTSDVTRPQQHAVAVNTSVAPHPPHLEKSYVISTSSTSTKKNKSTKNITGLKLKETV